MLRAALDVAWVSERPQAHPAGMPRSAEAPSDASGKGEARTERDAPPLAVVPPRERRRAGVSHPACLLGALHPSAAPSPLSSRPSSSSAGNDGVCTVAVALTTRPFGMTYGVDGADFIVVQVSEGSQAHAAGVRPGSRLVSVGEESCMGRSFAFCMDLVLRAALPVMVEFHSKTPGPNPD